MCIKPVYRYTCGHGVVVGIAECVPISASGVCILGWNHSPWDGERVLRLRRLGMAIRNKSGISQILWFVRGLTIKIFYMILSWSRGRWFTNHCISQGVPIGVWCLIWVDLLKVEKFIETDSEQLFPKCSFGWSLEGGKCSSSLRETTTCSENWPRPGLVDNYIAWFLNQKVRVTS